MISFTFFIIKEENSLVYEMVLCFVEIEYVAAPPPLLLVRVLEVAVGEKTVVMTSIVRMRPHFVLAQAQIDG